MTTAQVVLTGILAIFAGAGGSAIAAYFAKPKTKAEADQLNAAASVSLSADARAWAQTFADAARAAETRADAAEHRADEAEAKAEEADRKAVAAGRHADLLEENYDHIESLVIQGYGYVRKLQEEIRRLGGTPTSPPAELEALWSGKATWRRRMNDPQIEG